MDWTTVFTSAEFLSRIPSIILLITAIAITVNGRFLESVKKYITHKE